jgi:hypothetical protein
MVYTCFEIGRMIVQEEQHGENRAEYGKEVLNELSVRLTERFGKGFSARNLRNMRQFFLVYANDLPPREEAESKAITAERGGGQATELV